MDNLLDRLRRVVLAHDESDLTDGQLLESFLSRRDEASVAALVRRHGSMVWGICRRVLHNHHDAEDAFQATFLVLVRKADSIVSREKVGNWLYGVAYQTALKARANGAKRQRREKQVHAMPEPAAKPEADLGRTLETLLDQELSRLPEKYRVALVLCDLEGKTRKQAARQLKIPEGTFSTRLRTARTMLAKRLARHGLAVSGGLLAAALSQTAASESVPASVVSATIKAATLVAVGQAVTTVVIPVRVAALAEGVQKTMLLTKLKTATVGFLLLAALLGGAGLVYRTQAAEQSKERTVTATTEPDQPTASAEKEEPKSDKERLQGTWIPTLMEMNGVEIPFAFLQPREGLSATFTGNKLISNFMEEEANFHLHPSTNPKGIDLHPAKKRDTTLLGIYQLDRDDLKLCLCVQGKQERPPDFENYWKAGSRTFLVVLKRQKPSEKKTPKEAKADESQDVQVRITGPLGMKVAVTTARQDDKLIAIEVPGRLNLEQGKIHRLKLSNIPNRPGLEVFPTLEIPMTDETTKPFVTNGAIAIEFAAEDFDHVCEGKVIQKVVYLSRERLREWNTIASYNLEPGTDAIVEAKRRGAILAVVRMGNIDLGDGKLLKIEIGDDGIQGRVLRHDKENDPDNRANQRAKQEDIKKKLLELDELWWKGDVDTLRKLAADDLITVSGVGRYDKASLLAASKHRHAADWTRRNVEISLVSKDVAIVTYLYDCKIVLRDGTLFQNCRDRRVSMTWVNRKQGWVVVFTHETIRPGGE